VSPSPGKRPFLLVALLLGTFLLWLWLTHLRPSWLKQSHPESPDVSSQKNSLELRESEADKTFWGKEMLAQECARTFESLWDSINATSNKLELLGAFPVGEIVPPAWAQAEHLPHEIELRAGGPPGPTLSTDQWRSYVEEVARKGWLLDNIEFRHNRFDTDAKGEPQQSVFYFAARLSHADHLDHRDDPEARMDPSPRPSPIRRGEGESVRARAMIEGELVVNWGPKQAGEEFPSVKRVDASRLTLKTRAGAPFFQPILNETIVTEDKLASIDPLIVYDLDGDGRPEIILAAKNLVYRRTGEDRYEAQPLCRYPLDLITSAVVADFDGDGFADFLCATARGLFLFKGSGKGTFDDPPRQVWQANPPLKNVSVLTCGDIDGDGDLDVFLGQYKVPTLAQILRPTYYDANDSWPSYLLLNDGHGNFTDATLDSGLSLKRGRRVYSAAFADLDGDGHLDLVTASDFAGLDLYKNDGHGHFTDVTRQWVAEPHGFGMGLALADFNADGRLDLLMIGMPSPAVDRLEHLGLWRPYSADDRRMRSAMSFGNRLYLARAGGGFEQTALSDSIARSGWSWGCSAFDFDNDGFPDVYIANGLQGKESVRDYEAEFWLHDLFIGEDVDDVTVTKYFLQKFSRTRGHGWSYGGYEKNRLFLNRAGESFVEIGQLAGVALEQDCRNVVADDLDGDGRMDLLVTTLEVWPKVRQTLQIFKNNLQDHGHWIGFRFREEGNEKSPVGARVTIHYSGRSAVRQIVTGDSHRSQHSATIHFGLGDTERVESAEIQWVNGSSIVLRGPAVDHYTNISTSRKAGQ
jgi:hypothetical protein